MYIINVVCTVYKYNLCCIILNVFYYNFQNSHFGNVLVNPDWFYI